ncbi:hypothetical protein F4824DRAFT_286222 [Ustulina deusta]|nr:hypothetical protein F4824DRAFT_286222 [Ustulina deusta]
MSNKHLPLKPRCGACADSILRHERVVALSGNDDSTVCTGCTQPFAFPLPSMVPIWVNGRILCRRNKCNQCVSAPEFIPIHYDCYQIFRGNVNLDESEALDLLWTIGSWRNPWSRAQPIYLGDAIDQVGLERISKISGLSDLCRLPPELVGMIRDLSPHQLFWRSIFVIALSPKIP